MNRDTQKIANDIRELEDGFCNPRKLKQAEELREELAERGYSKREIDEMVGDD